METYGNRKYTISLMFILIGLAFLFRLGYMQLVDSHWVERAAQISERKVVTYPARGIVFDRNHKKLIANEIHYDLMVIPKKIKEIDSFSFAKLVGIPI